MEMHQYQTILHGLNSSAELKKIRFGVLKLLNRMM